MVRPRLRASAGQSLVELMMAVSILATALLASLRSQMSSVRLMKSARETEIATELLREAMAQSFLATNEELIDDGGGYSPGASITTQRALVDQEVQYTLPDVEGGVVPEFLAVSFQIAWTSSTGERRTLTMSGGKR
jgi:type II secretory pathway pseudopilin PulG